MTESVSSKNRPLDSPKFWADNATTDWWHNQDQRYGKFGQNSKSEEYMLLNFPREVKSVLEVGAGTGRLIGMLGGVEAHSVDINAGLCDIVKKRFPHVTTHNCSAESIDMPDNSVDMVYTFQMLQHVPNDLIMAVLTEMMRITKDRLWLMEGYKPDKEQGEITHKSNGGSYVYYFDRIFKCESVEESFEGLIRIYKIRKNDNLDFSIELGARYS